MGMIDEAVLELNWLKKVNQEILETDDADSAWAKPWIKHCESVTQALDSAIEIMQKYQKMQADYNARLKADMAAMLTELQLEVEELCIDNILSEDEEDINRGIEMAADAIQEKINELKAEK